MASLAVAGTQQSVCTWCGGEARTVCGRCKARAYCSSECQRADWRSGHQTACSPPVLACPPAQPDAEDRFEYFQVPHVARWIVDLQKWKLDPGGREFRFLRGTLPEEMRKWLDGLSWPDAKVALAKELAVRRMAEVMTQAMWHKVRWKHDEHSDRDYLVSRDDYIWTGKKYQNSNLRFPNFNFSMVECDGKLFLASHPAVLTGLFVGGPLSEALPDPREEFAEQLAACEAAEAADADGSADRSQDTESSSRHPDEEDTVSCQLPELRDLCAPSDVADRRRRLLLALAAKMAYFRTIGQTEACKWSSVVLGSEPVGESVPTGELLESASAKPRLGGPRRHPLAVAGEPQKRWRCDVHSLEGGLLAVVCRAPPSEASPTSAEFVATQRARFLEIDLLDDALGHAEPDFIEVPIGRLLPDKHRSEYLLACS